MSEWIKCSERLPEFGVEVIVYEPDAKPNVVSASYERIDGFEGFLFTDECLADVCPQGPRATHWQPLPLPPEQE